MNWIFLAISSLVLLFIAGCTNMGATSKLPPGTPMPVNITVQADQPGAKINSAMWGAFFEDINFGADGGLYAEMVKNRSFEFPDAMMGWYKIAPSMAKGDVTILTDNPFHPNQPHFARISSKADAPIGITNEGFRGMGVKAGDSYDFSMQTRLVDGTPKLAVEIVGADGTTLAERLTTNAWSKVTATLKPKDTDSHARLALFIRGTGTVDVDFVSLFPQKTWKNRAGGMRADMVQMLADLKPGFLRFPGGCIVEGSVLDRRYQWKNTIGPIEDRKLLINRWNYEFKHRPTPDYFQSYGLGFFEFFQLCEDIGAEPLPILNCGMACQFNSGELCPVDALGPYIQDALDLIEFANGPADSPWGAKRAAMGHPEPFNPPVKMMGVGNEQWGPQYLERLAAFTKAIKEKYPDFNLVSDAGPSPEDDRFAYLWPRLVDAKADIVDQHCYANPAWFLANSTRFDKYDRNGPRIFFGEYAAQSVAIVSTKNQNNLDCALAEAAYMTGLERNAEVVRMASYAPLYSNTDAWQWTPNLMWTDSLRVMPTPNYYVQQLYCRNKGDVVLPTTNDGPVSGYTPMGRIGLGTIKASAEFKDVRVTKNNQVIFSSDFARGAAGWSGRGSWKVVDGAYQQSDPEASTSSFAGEMSWSDYTLTFKVRRTSDTGAINITVLDDFVPGSASRAQWILGAPVGNLTVADPSKPEFILQTHFAEQDALIDHKPGTLEKDKWYSVLIRVSGSYIECALDDNVIHTARILERSTPQLFTSAVRDDSNGVLILKVANPGDRPAVASVHLDGAGNVHSAAQVTTLSGNPAAVNTLDHQANVVPETKTVNGISSRFNYTFAPYSFTVFRIATR